MMSIDELQRALDGLRRRISEKVEWRQPAASAAVESDDETLSPPDDHARTPGDLGIAVRRWQVAGWAIIGVFLIGGTVFAAHARIDGAAVALGTVGAETNRKSVAHLEGGIIKAILVNEGEHVEKGQTLAVMDNTRAHATLELLQGRKDALIARRARLAAERRDLPTIEFPASLLDRADAPKVMDLMEGEMQVLETRRSNLERRDSILKERIQQQNAEIRGLKAKRHATRERRKLLVDEHEMMSALLKDGLIARNRVLGIERALAEAEGDVHDLSAKIAKAGDEIGKLEMERALLLEEHQRETAAALQDVTERLAETNERIRAARDILTRTAILAPEDGVVVELRHHTPGGVVQGGEPILDLVPNDDRMIVEVRIDPNDIDVVYPGQNARIQLSAFNARTTPAIEGKVVQVSADRIVDPVTGAGYFSGRVLPNETPDAAARPTLLPGMQAEVFLVTAERSVLDYLLDPLTRSLRRAGREL